MTCDETETETDRQTDWPTGRRDGALRGVTSVTGRRDGALRGVTGVLVAEIKALWSQRA